MKRLIYFGPPGTGKTTTLLTHLEQALKEGVPPEAIAFLTFTRRARREALERVHQVLGIEARDLPHFRTIHSMAFKGLGLKEGDVMGRAQLNTFGEAMGLKFGANAASELAAEGINSNEMGDALLALDNLARLRGHSIKETWTMARTGIDWHTVDHFAHSYAQYKRDTGLLDFTDVLAEFTRQKKTLDVDVAFIDEAQDLSALQWLAALQAVESAAVQYVAGDDDQAIYRWAGAEVEVFMTLPGERRVLSKSYRLPSVIHTLSGRILTRIKSRVAKEFAPRGEGGEVRQHANVTSLSVKSGENWLWLVRNRYLIPPLREVLELNSVVYTQHGFSSINETERDILYDWERLRAGKPVVAGRVRVIYKNLKTKTQVAHGFKALPGIEDETPLTMEQLRTHHGLLADGTWYHTLNFTPERKAYYRALLRTHGTLKLAPQVQLETIHGAKGTEAPQVALFLEMSRRVWEESQRTPDEEHRVWYVGATRAREVLHVIQGNSQWNYPLPVGGSRKKVVSD